MYPYVFDIQKFSVHDGPGIRTVVFLKGCPMKCQWCANPESQLYTPEVIIHPDKCIGCGKCKEACDILKNSQSVKVGKPAGCKNCGDCVSVCCTGARSLIGKQMTPEELIREIDKDIIFYNQSGGGVTFSGGEAMMYPEFISEIAGYYKEKGISTAVETCGDVPWENFEKAIPYINLVLFDLKLMNSDQHLKYTGRPNDRIIDNLKKISNQVETIIRIPIIPTINDYEENIEGIGKFIESLEGRIKKVHILPYHNYGMSKYKGLGKDYLLKDLKATDNEHMEMIRESLCRYGADVIIGG